MLTKHICKLLWKIKNKFAMLLSSSKNLYLDSYIKGEILIKNIPWTSFAWMRHTHCVTWNKNYANLRAKYLHWNLCKQFDLGQHMRRSPKSNQKTIYYSILTASSVHNSFFSARSRQHFECPLSIGAANVSVQCKCVIHIDFRPQNFTRWVFEARAAIKFNILRLSGGLAP